MDARRYVVVGAGPAGRAAYDALRAAEPDATAELVTTEDPAVALTLGERSLGLSSGRTVTWDRLLLATGTEPVTPVPGSGLAGVHVLGRSGAVAPLTAALARGGSTVVVGASWHALRAVAYARERGAAVTWLVPGERPLEAVVAPELADVVVDLRVGHGVDVRTGVGLGGVTGHERVEAAVVSDGRAIETHLVVVDPPRRPADRLAAAAGLAVEDGVVVGPDLRCPGDTGVLAAGSVARVWSDRFAGHVRLEDDVTAVEQGRAAARAMTGAPAPGAAAGAPAGDHIPRLSLVLFGTTVEWVGHAARYDEVVYRFEQEGEDDESLEQLSALWVLDGRVDAAATVGQPEATGRLAELVSAGAAPGG